MKNFASSPKIKNKFLILGCGFTGSFFAKTIRKYDITVLTSSRSKNENPNSVLQISKPSLLEDTILKWLYDLAYF